MPIYCMFSVRLASSKVAADDTESAETGAPTKPPSWFEAKDKFWEEQKKRGFVVDLKNQNALSGMWKRAIAEDLRLFKMGADEFSVRSQRARKLFASSGKAA